MIILEVKESGLIKVIEDNIVSTFQFIWDPEKMNLGIVRLMAESPLLAIHRLFSIMLTDSLTGSNIEIELAEKVIDLLSIEHFETLNKILENTAFQDPETDPE
jgi:hypothetical protein